MTTIQRFILDEERRIIDTLHPANPRGFLLDGEPKGEIHLREKIFWSSLFDPVNDLITNLRPERAAWDGTKYKPYNKEAHGIWRVIYKAIRASQLNVLEPAVSLRNRFTGTLKRQKIGLQDFTSLSLFRDDVERLLRDLYGDIDSEALERTLCSVLIIVKEFTQFARKDLWQEHQNAMNWDYIWGIGLPDGYGISGSDHRRGMMAVSDLGTRVRKVRKNPSAFSKYTVEFARACEERIVVADNDTVAPADGSFELEIPF